MRILFGAWPAYGHLLPMVPLIRAAQQAGHEVVVSSGADMSALIDRLGVGAHRSGRGVSGRRPASSSWWPNTDPLGSTRMTTENLAPTGTALAEANLFDISGPIRIGYARSSISGEPQLSYQDAELDLAFQGEQLDRTQTSMGELVSVTVEVVPDAFSRLVTLLVPTIRLPMGEELGFSTLLVETVDRSAGFVPPPGPAGVLQRYRVHQLYGTAKVVAF